MSDDVTGANPEAVLDLLRARMLGEPHDASRRRLGLIVEGGGMRGVLSAGSLLALDTLGGRQCFDDVFATSAGAVNAAYFLSGQGALGITVYFDSINNRRFFNPWRVTKMVDVGYVYDHIVPNVKPLDERPIRDGKTNLLLSLTDAHTGRNVLFDVKESDVPIHRVLKASSALPILYNRTVSIDGISYVDGGVTCTLPIRQAAARGCTDILIILTKSSGYSVPPPTAPRKALLYLLLGHRYPGVMSAYSSLADETNRDRRLAVGAERIDGVNVATICPAEAESVVQRTTIDRKLLVEGAHAMAVRTCRILGESTAAVDTLFRDYRQANVPGNAAKADVL